MSLPLATPPTIDKSSSQTYCSAPLCWQAMLWSQIFCKVYELRFVQQFYKSCVKCCRKKIRFVKTFVGLQLYHWKYSVSETLEEVYCFEKVYANKILKQAKLAIPKSIKSLWSKKLVACLSVRTLLLWLVCSVGK